MTFAFICFCFCLLQVAAEQAAGKIGQAAGLPGCRAAGRFGRAGGVLAGSKEGALLACFQLDNPKMTIFALGWVVVILCPTIWRGG